MGEITKTNEELAKKEALGAYVHDMVDLEIRALSLRETAKESRKKAEEKEEKAKQHYDYLNGRRERNEDALMSARSRKNALKPNERIPALFIVIPSIFTVLSLVQAGLEGFWPVGVIYFAIAIVLWAIAIPIGKLVAIDTHYYDELSLIKNKIQELTLESYTIDSDLAYAKVELSQAKESSKSLIAHADTLDKNAAEVESAIRKNYALNLIPPDYRRLQCLVWIDYAFRNDQVDTMREATLQCDKWVRHNDVMTALRELAENIRSVAVLLEDMNANIAMMNQDLLNIAQAQEKQLSETKSARYAMESVQRSTEKLEWYEKLKHQRIF